MRIPSKNKGVTRANGCRDGGGSSTSDIKNSRFRLPSIHLFHIGALDTCLNILGWMVCGYLVNQ